MLRKSLILALAIAGCAVTLPAAAIAPIVSQADGAEADQIMVTLHGNGGNAVALGCDKCPIRADIDAKTRFFLRGQSVSRNDAEKLSGETGTIVYSKDRVIKILWDTGRLK